MQHLTSEHAEGGSKPKCSFCISMSHFYLCKDTAYNNVPSKQGGGKYFFFIYTYFEWNLCNQLCECMFFSCLLYAFLCLNLIQTFFFSVLTKKSWKDGLIHALNHCESCFNEKKLANKRLGVKQYQHGKQMDTYDLAAQVLTGVKWRVDTSWRQRKKFMDQL